MAITFPVCDVAPAERPMAALDRAVAIPSLLGGPRTEILDRYVDLDGGETLHPRRRPPPLKIEAFSSSDARLVCANDAHALAQAAHDAFYRHHPLVLSPDAVWFCLAQGFAHHVSLHAEELRSRFVRHEGKQKLVIVRPDFELGRPNPWPEAFAAFSDQIASRIGKLRDLVVADFSTTGPIERAASEVVLMDAFQAYFEYEMLAGCGIPSITLLGTPDDWRSIRRRAAMFSELGLEHWTDALLPVLDQLVRTAEGHVDTAFWRSFFRYQSGSGPSELTGWILVLFPYLKLGEGNGPERLMASPYLDGWERALRSAESRTGWRIDHVEGPALGAIPSSLASAPVKYTDLRTNESTMLRFVAGLFGVTQDVDSHALAPEFGWAVVHEPLELDHDGGARSGTR